MKINNGRKYWMGKIEKINGTYKIEVNGILREYIYNTTNVDEAIEILMGSEDKIIMGCLNTETSIEKIRRIK